MTNRSAKKSSDYVSAMDCSDPIYQNAACCSADNSLKRRSSPDSDTGSDQQRHPLNNLIKEASTAYAQGDLLTALDAYSRVLRHEPRNNILHANVSAILLCMDGRKSEALEAAERAIELRPDWPKAHFRRGEALCALGHLDEAILAHADALRLSDGQEDQFRRALITCAELSGTIGESFSRLFAQLQLANLDKHTLALLSVIAEAFVDSKNAKFALRLLRFALEKKISHEAPPTIALSALGQLALLETQEGNWPNALKALESQLEIAKNLADESIQISVHGAMAKLLSTKLPNSVDLALAHRRKQILLAEKLSISVIPFRIALAHLHMAKRDFGQAQGIFKDILGNEPTNPEALLGLGQAFFGANEFSSAISMFNRIERLEAPEDDGDDYIRMDALLWRCRCYIARGDSQKAVEVAEKTLASDQFKSRHNIEAIRSGLYSVLARGKAANGKWSEAMRWAKRLLRSQIGEGGEEKLVDTLGLMMTLYVRTGQWKNAGKLADRLFDCLPSHKQCPDGLLDEMYRIQNHLGQWKRAQKVMEWSMEREAEGSREWARKAMELAKLTLDQGNPLKKCRALVQKLVIWSEVNGANMEAESNQESTNIRWEVDLLKLRAEMAWMMRRAANVAEELQSTDPCNTESPEAVFDTEHSNTMQEVMEHQQESASKDTERTKLTHDDANASTEAEDVEEDAFELLEHALMLAQEASSMGDAEADICLRLGEWHAEEGAYEEAAVYLRQVIAQERAETDPSTVDQNQRQRLLRAYACLSRVLCRQGQWEDAFIATRCQLTVLKGVASEQLDPRERFRSQLELCRILLEANRDNREGFAGGAETAAKMCRRVRRRARDADAQEELEQAEALLEECRKAMDGEEEEMIDQGEEVDRNRRVIGGRGKVPSHSREIGNHRRRNKSRRRSYRHRSRSRGHQSETDQEWLSDEAESTTSGARVLGVDFQGNGDEERGIL